MRICREEKDTRYDAMSEQRLADADDLKDCLYDEMKEADKETKKIYTLDDLDLENSVVRQRKRRKK